MDDRGEYARKYAQIVLRAWNDEAFKRRLITDPKAVLRDYGIAVPDHLDLRVVENTERVFYINLPAKPTDELSEDDLDALAGGDLTAVFGSPGLPAFGPYKANP